jgi:putative ABC transport system permease protein
MIRHIVIAALRNMAANKLLSALAVIGLSLGVTATLVVALLIEGILSFNHFIPDYKNVVMVGMPDTRAGHGYTRDVDSRVAGLLALALPQVEVAARLVNGSGRFHQGHVAAAEGFYWADPGYFQVMPFPVLRGNLRTALARPDSVVMTSQTAQKYFGRDDVVGQTLRMDGHPLTVTAILKPLPPQSWYRGNPMFVSAQSAFSPLAGGGSNVITETYLRFKPQAGLRDSWRQAHAAVAPLLVVHSAVSRDAYADAPLLVPIDRVALDTQLDPGALTEFSVASAVAMLLLVLSSVNCVSLMVARIGRRTTEVMMRKVCGAGRGTLILQFLSEAVLTVLLAVILAVALTEWLTLLPALGQGAPLNILHDPYQAPALSVYVVLLGVMVGAWPALVLSSFRPARLSREVGNRSTGPARRALVILQFTAVIMMLIASLVIDSQRRYAEAHPLGADIANVLGIPLGCRPPFLAEIRKLPGVMRAACSDGAFPDGSETLTIRYHGTQLQLDQARAGGDTMAVYGVAQLAGVPLPPEPEAGEVSSPVMAVNHAAALRLGFAAPEAAIGTVPFPSGPLAGKRIVAVMPDFAFYPPREPIAPTVFVPEAAERAMVHVKLHRAGDSATLAAIDRVWHETGGTGQDERYFVSDHHDTDLEMNAIILAACALLAVFLACLGLAGLTVAAAERRTKEIGVRKAMGASTAQVALLLLEHFVRPVFWASLIAWPLSAWLMWKWQSSFAYHGAFPYWAFAVASGAALLIALLAVAWQAWLAARQKPVLALRYE